MVDVLSWVKKKVDLKSQGKKYIDQQAKHMQKKYMYIMACKTVRIVMYTLYNNNSIL